MTSLLGSKHEHAGDFEEPYVCYVLSNLFSSDSGDTWLSLVVCLNERSRPEVRVGHRRKLFGDVILILAAELSIACFPDNSAQSRTAAWDRAKCGSLFVRYVGLLSPKGPKPLNSSPC